MLSIDKEMKSNNAIAYFRYVDDIIILCNGTEIESIKESIINALHKFKLESHDMNAPGSKSNTGYVKETIEYLGYKFHENTISVRRSSVDGIESGLVEAFTQYAKALQNDPLNSALKIALENQCLRRLNLKITGCFFEGNGYGWVRYFSQMNDLTLLKQRDASVIRLIKRFNMPPNFKPKTFTRTYWEIVNPRPNSNYIPNFDDFKIIEMKTYLETVVGKRNVNSIPDEEIQQIFRMEIRKLTRELNQDVRSVS